MKLRVTLLGALSLLAAGHAVARPGAQTATVVELFTSQGCSSCPPADSLLKTYAQRTDLVALSLSVDYWDHLGWKDTLASPKFSERQRAYAKTLGTGNVYTPQIVIDGVAQAVGSAAAKVDKAIAYARNLKQDRVDVSAALLGNEIRIDVAGGGGGDVASSPATIWFAVVSPRVDVPVKRGENRGSTLAYYNVVRSLTPVGMYSGKPLRIDLPPKAMEVENKRCAVLVQAGEGGRIIGAAWMAK